MSLLTFVPTTYQKINILKKISMFGDFVSDAKMQEFKNIQ